MDQEGINVNIKAENGELIIRHGEALKARERRREILECTLGGVKEWIDKRKGLFEQSQSLITYDVNEGSIHFTENISDELSHIVTDRIEMDPDLQSFGINSGKYESPDALAGRLRSLANCFSNRALVMKLVASLKNFEAKVNREIRDSDNDHGSVKKVRSQVVESNLPENFTIWTPIIKGNGKESIEVEIYANESLQVTLFSYDVTEQLHSAKRLGIEDQINGIKESFPEIPIIEV